METVSLQDLIKDVAAQLLQSYEGKTTGAGSTLYNYIDGNFGTNGAGAYYQDEWNGSQVIFEEPAYTLAGCINPGPHALTSFDSVSGAFVASTPFRASGVVPAGLSYFLIHPRGQGVTYNGYLAALRYALDRLDVRTESSNSTLTTAANDWDYTIPAGLGWVYDVVLSKAGYYPVRLTPGQWRLYPGRTLWLNYDVPVGSLLTINLYGYSEDALPTTLNGTVVCNRGDVVDMAVEYLRRSNSDGGDNSRADRLTQERLRFRRDARPANMRRVLP